MSINRIFPNPTVKKVIFQIKFPNLFYMEDKIGEFQLKIINEYPDSGIIYRKPIVFTDIGPNINIDEIKNMTEPMKKIWQFRSPNNYQLNVLSDSLNITSNYHKTYNNESEGIKFRDTIKTVLDNFIEVTGIPTVTRIGLRYIDECPVPEKNNAKFKEYYNTTFPLARFKLENTSEMAFRAVSKRGNYFLRFAETLKKGKDKYYLELDYDGFAYNIHSDTLLEVTDKLHKIILKEFENSIKDPVYNYMKKKKE